MKCILYNCYNEATHRIYWTENRSAPACEGCKDFALRVASAIGSYLVVHQLSQLAQPTDPEVYP